MSKSDTAKLIKKVKEPVGVKPYVLGAAGPDAFDCSGLMQWAYKSIGIDIPRTTFDQKDAGEIIWDRSKDGGEIPEDKLKPGDLILFDGFGHVAMYTGDGMVSNAATDGVPLENQIEYEPIANAGTTPERVVRIDDAIANGSVDGDSSSSDENKTTDSSYENCFCESGETAASEYEDTNGESSASPHEFYEKNAKFIIKEARNKGLSNEQTALALAIADANSGLANVANKSKKGNEKVPGDRIARSVEHNPEGDTEDEAGRMGLFFLIPGEHGEVKELMDKKYSTEYVFNKIASIEGLTSDNWDEKVEPLGLHLKNKPSKSQKIANELLENNGITNSMKKEKEDKKKDKKSNRRQGGSYNGSNSKAYEKRGVKLPDPSPYNPEGVKAYEKLKGVYGPGLPDAADWYRVAMYESTDNVNQPPVMAVNEPAGGLYAIPASRWNPVAEKAGVKKVKDSYEIPKRSREEQTKIAVEMWKEVGWMYWGTVYGTPEQKAAGLAPHANQAEGGPGHGVELNTMNAISWDGKAKAKPGSSEGSDDDQFGDDSYECSSDNDSDSDSVGKGTGELNSDGIPEEYVKLIEDAASETKNIDPASLAAILSIESGFNPKASSGVAHGIAQFTPDTWASKGNGGDIWDPKDAIPASARFLDELYDNAEKEIEKNGGKGDDPLELMAASYNGGPGSIQAGACGTPARVPKCGDPNNFSSYAGQTAPYVEKFMKEREKFSK